MFKVFEQIDPLFKSKFQTDLEKLILDDVKDEKARAYLQECIYSLSELKDVSFKPNLESFLKILDDEKIPEVVRNDLLKKCIARQEQIMEVFKVKLVGEEKQRQDKRIKDAYWSFLWHGVWGYLKWVLVLLASLVCLFFLIKLIKFFWFFKG